MSEPEEPQIDASMWPDSRLRPWTIDNELDQQIVDENLKLDDRVLKTSGSKLAGRFQSFRGIPNVETTSRVTCETY